jgi:hypothetical protein
MIKTLARSILPSSLRMAIYEARERPWKRDISQWCYDWLPDKYVHSAQFKAHFGRPLNWEAPTTFNEKIHWLSLNHQLPIMTQCADKYAVREFVTQRGCGHILNDLYGVWDDPAYIDFTTLPSSFVLKVNHGSGQNLICKEKASFNVGAARQKLVQWMKRSEYWVSREWAYKDITPRIICERLLKDEHGNVPTDYKFFCFNGEPMMIQVITDRFTEHKRDLFDIHWNVLPFILSKPSSGQVIPKPSALVLMIETAKALSHGFPFVRVDLYAIGPAVTFGEMTWYPEGGLARFTPDDYDTRYGEMIVLPR